MLYVKLNEFIENGWVMYFICWLWLESDLIDRGDLFEDVL